MSVTLTDHEADYFATLLRTESAKSREAAKILDTIANALMPPGDLPEPSRASHSS